MRIAHDIHATVFSEVGRKINSCQIRRGLESHPLTACIHSQKCIASPRQFRFSVVHSYIQFFLLGAFRLECCRRNRMHRAMEIARAYCAPLQLERNTKCTCSLSFLHAGRLVRSFRMIADWMHSARGTLQRIGPLYYFCAWPFDREEENDASTPHPVVLHRLDLCTRV